METTQVVDCSTGEVEERPLTQDEQAERTQIEAEAAQRDQAEAATQEEATRVQGDLNTLRAKAKTVFAGDGTFTAAQSQKILAGLVLRLTRD